MIHKPYYEQVKDAIADNQEIEVYEGIFINKKHMFFEGLKKDFKPFEEHIAKRKVFQFIASRSRIIIVII